MSLSFLFSFGQIVFSISLKLADDHFHNFGPIYGNVVEQLWGQEARLIQKIGNSKIIKLITFCGSSFQLTQWIFESFIFWEFLLCLSKANSKHTTPWFRPQSLRNHYCSFLVLVTPWAWSGHIWMSWGLVHRVGPFWNHIFGKRQYQC